MDDNAEIIAKIAQSNNGFVRSRDVRAVGIHSSCIKKLLDEGYLEQLKRGLYRSLKAPVSEYDSMLQAYMAVPRGVVCLLTALSYYGMTTVTPREICMAIEKHRRFTLPEYPPIKLYLYSPPAYAEGITEIRIGGVAVKIYDKEKTLCDCIKYRQQIGMDVIKEALREYLRNSGRNIEKLRRYAKTCRIESVLTKYLEVML